MTKWKCIKILMQKPWLWCKPLIQAHKGQWQIDFCKFKANLFYTMSFKIPGLCREIVSQNPPQINKQNNAEEWNQQYLLNPLRFCFICFDF